jgi:beta-glucosidase-like glycosyl hydrolase
MYWWAGWASTDLLSGLERTRQVQTCSNDSCAASFNAGLDIFMVPEDCMTLFWNTLQQVQSGDISQQRLDEAVADLASEDASAYLMHPNRLHAKTLAVGTCWLHRNTGQSPVKLSGNPWCC